MLMVNNAMTSRTDNIMWLTVDNIEEKEGQVINEVADIVGSGQSVGGVVSQTVGSMDKGDNELQVCRMNVLEVRCRCPQLDYIFHLKFENCNTKTCISACEIGAAYTYRVLWRFKERIEQISQYMYNSLSFTKVYLSEHVTH